MNKHIKMVAFDLDGTLLNSEKQISNRTWEAIKKAADQGVVVLPATGRPLGALPKELRECPDISYAVTANGARVVNTKTGEAVFQSAVSVETALEILKIFEDYDCHQEAFVDGVSYAGIAHKHELEDYYSHKSMAEYIRQTRTFVDSVSDKVKACGKPLEKVQAFFRHDADFEHAKGRLDQIEGIVLTSAMKNNWEANKAGTDKGNALLGLGEILGIRREEIMACGDGMNDYAMIQKVGVGVVMENGTEELKEIADYITVSNDDDGVAEVIERMVLC